MAEEKCVRCGDVGYDRRTLSMRCLYEMKELNVPFHLNQGGEYWLLVCKPCRGDWLQAIEHWFNKKPKYETYTERVPWKVCDER